MAWLPLVSRSENAVVTRKFMTHVTPTGRERTFPESDIIVSKTDLTGKITYANEVFLRVASLTEAQAIGAPHSIIRHPAMPRAVFKLLWDTIGSGREIFAYVLNMASTGDHYWVFAHVTPTFGPDGAIVGYHSNRRSPDRRAIAAVEPIYRDLLSIEQGAGARGLEASVKAVTDLLAAKGVSYDEFVFSL